MGRAARRLVPGLALAVVLAFVVQSGGGGHGPNSGARAGAPDIDAIRTRVALVPAEGGTPGLTVAAARIGGRASAKLADQAIAPLAGWLSPVAVPSPDGRRIVYSAWRQLREDDPQRSWSEQGIAPGDPLARPSLRLHDLSTGADSVLAEGAFSAAWRSDGALAYVRGVRPEYRAWERYVGDLVVRDGPHGRDVLWSDVADRYVAAAWAGATLLAYRIREGEQLDLLAFDGPRRMRVLGHDTSLVAVSPDGREAAIADASAIPGALRILDIRDGEERAQLPLGDERTRPLTWIGYAGSWKADLVAAESDAGLAVFRVDGDSVSLVRLLELDRDAFPHGAVEPQFASGDEIVARAETGSDRGAAAAPTVLLDCDRVRATCSRLASAEPREWLRFVYNPSRPFGGMR
jgi:hypothetical protein